MTDLNTIVAISALLCAVLALCWGLYVEFRRVYRRLGAVEKKCRSLGQACAAQRAELLEHRRATPPPASETRRSLTPRPPPMPELEPVEDDEKRTRIRSPNEPRLPRWTLGNYGSRAG